MTDSHRPRIKFDHHSRKHSLTWEQKVRELHVLDYPLAWSESHGGYWVLGSWAAIKAANQDWETFSSDNDVKCERRGGKGASIPQRPYPLVLSESDPPLSTARRKLELPFFLPKMIREWEPIVQRYVTEAIDRVVGQGEADLLWDIVIPTTARTTLSIVGYDPDDWRDAALSAHRVSFTLEGDPDYPAAEVARVQAGFRNMLADRRARSHGDIASALANGVVEGRPLTEAEGESMMTAIVLGGFDTTTTAALNALRWLARNREVHSRLLAEPAFLDNGVDEWLRIWPPAPGIGRTVMRDVEIGGRRLSKGERIYMWFAAANRDPVRWERPEEVILDRPRLYDHLSFSAGGHRCLGAPLAKVEIAVMVREVLRRLPDYRIDEEDIERYPSFGSVSGYLAVPFSFGPGVAAGQLAEA